MVKKSTKNEVRQPVHTNTPEKKTKLFREISLIIVSAIITAILTVSITSFISSQNEIKKEKGIKQKLINDLNSAWAADSSHINEVLKVAKQEVASINFLFDNYHNRFSTIDDSIIDYNIHYASHSLAFRPKISTYEVNRYNDKLKFLSDSIQEKIFELYDVIYKRNFLLVEHHQDFISNKIDIYLLEHSKFIGFSNFSYSLKIDKVNANKLFEDDKFKHYQNYNRTLINLVINNYIVSLERIKKLIEMIRKEEI